MPTEHPFGKRANRLDSNRVRSYDPRMPVWRCPHCSTPQAEASRCWVCRRSTTSCATCRHFRKGVAGGLGLCGLDPRRLALNGTEMRPCWIAKSPPIEVELRWTGSTHVRVPGDAVGRTAAATPMTAAAVAGVGGRMSPDVRGSRGPRTFVPVDGPEPAAAASIDTDVRGAVPAPVNRVPGTWWLWGDPEPWPEG